MKRVAQATAAILKKAGVDFGILGSKENCCGESIRKTGAEEVFRRVARENIKAFIDAGVKRILVSSPHCYHTFVNEYPEFRVNFEIVHISEYLLELMEAGRITVTGEYPKRVTWHDPCYLGRHNGIYDAPRRVLQRVPGLELVEMVDSKKASLCCGGGGGRIWMDTPNEERFSNLRLVQARETGAAVLATACPYCITNFEESRLNLEFENLLEVRDLTEIVRDVI
jgi:Fe-S oxidoreductase